METWIASIGAFPVATLIVAMGGIIYVQARYIVKQQDQRIADKDAAFQKVTELAVATNTGLSSAAQGMTAAAAGMNSAREAMQTATAVMERIGR